MKYFVLIVIVIAIFLCAFVAFLHIGKSKAPAFTPTQIDYSINLAKVQDFATSPIIHSPDDSTVVSFTALKNQSRNSGANVIVGNTVIGNIDGKGISSSSFSADATYLALQTISICGADCQQVQLYVVNISNTNIIKIQIPKKDVTPLDTQTYSDVAFVIDSYQWEGNFLEGTSFYVGKDKGTGLTYQLSATETWKYDPVSGTYSTSIEKGLKTT